MWPIVLREIAGFEETNVIKHPSWAGESLSDSSDVDAKEEERSWRDPSAFKTSIERTKLDLK